MPSFEAFQQTATALCICAFHFPIASTANAQDPAGGSVSVHGSEIRIVGVIDEEVANSFFEQFRAHQGLQLVSLNSPGGRVFPALDIARAIDSAGLNTSVHIGDECYSACSLIFLSGHQRIADGFLGVHQVSGLDDPSLTQAAIGQIFEELVKFNTPSYVVSHMLRTPPDDLYVFTPEELEREEINIRDPATQAGNIPQLLAVETWMRDDWLVGTFMNTHINMPFVAIESREMDPLMRIVNYPHRAETFVEFMFPAATLTGTKTRLEMRFSHGSDEPYSLFVDADIEPKSYAFDIPKDPEQSAIFWAAFAGGTQLTILNGYGIELARYSLQGSKQAVEDFFKIATF